MTEGGRATHESGQSTVLETMLLLDSPPEERFDRLAELAQQVFEVDATAVVLQHESHRWVKAWQGRAELRNDRILALLDDLPNDAPIIVSDAAQNAHDQDRSRYMPPATRFIAAMPLLLDGTLVGSLCLLHSQPRELSAQQQHVLRTLANCVEGEIGLLWERHLRLQVAENEKQYRKQIERVSRVAEETSNAVVITDRYGCVEWVNESFTRITGYTFDEVRGRTPGELLQGQGTNAKTVREMTEAVAAGRPFNLDIVNYTKSGKRFWMQVSCDVLLNDAGELEGFVAIESDISRQKNSEILVNELLDRIEKLTANLPGIIYQFQQWPDGHFSMPYVSGALSKRFGIDVINMDQDAAPILDLIDPVDKSEVMRRIEVSAEHLNDWESRFRLVEPAGTVNWVEGRATPERLPDGSTVWHGFLADINERKRLEQAQEEQSQHTQAILDNVINGIITINEVGIIESTNPAAENVFGYSTDQMVGMRADILIPNLHQLGSGQDLTSEAKDAPFLSLGINLEVEGIRANGHSFPMELAVSEISREGKLLYIAVIRDISQRKEAEQEINNLAFFDPLTHLPNRRLFYDRLDHARAVSKRNNNYGALLFIDLDNFKRLNDTAGHYTGDKLLKVVAKRLVSCVRDNDTVARLGGDEFVLILENVGDDVPSSVLCAESVGEKIRQSLNEPYAEIYPPYEGTPSIGVTLFNDDEESAEELLKQVDMAMYQAKAAGRNRVVFFDPDMQAAAVAYATLENELRTALFDQQFELFYQVQVDGSGEATGAEALLRWHHPKRGCVRPNEFVALAEETRLIIPIGRWVIQEACRQLAIWARHSYMSHLTLAVNVSALQMAEPDFVELVLESLRQTGANPNKLKLELTETLLAEDMENVIAKMKVLRDNGVNFALDDFGTGYSSLSYLKKMPIEQLKIDQSFVRDILIDDSDSIIAKAIIALAKSMDLGVIAEGVESEAHRCILAAEGCINHQGYLFGHPIPVTEFEQSLRQH